MADHMIDGGIQRILKAVLALAGGAGVQGVHDVVFDQCVDIQGGHARLEVRIKHGKHGGQQTSGFAHQLNGFGCFNHGAVHRAS